MKLRIKLLLPLALLMVIFSLILHLYWLPEYRQHERESFLHQEQSNLEVLATSLVPSLLSSDLARIYGTLDTLLERRLAWKKIYLQNQDGVLVYPFGATDEQYQQPHSDRIRWPVKFEEKVIGYLEVEVDINQQLEESVGRIQMLELIMFLILFAVTVAAALLQDRWIRRPLTVLANATTQLARGEFTLALPKRSSDEVGQLISAFQLMCDELAQRESSVFRQQLQLTAISQALTGYIRGEAPEQLFHHMLDQVLNLTHSDGGLLFSMNEEHLVPLSHISRQSLEGMMPSPEGGLSEAMAVIIGDSRGCDTLHFDNDSELLDIYNYLRIPLCSGEQPIGMLVLVNRKNGYDQALIQFLEPILNTCTNILVAIDAAQSRQLIQAQVQERETRMRTVLNNIVDGIIIIDDHGIIESFNPAAERIFGYREREVVGENVSLLMPRDIARHHDEYLKAFRARGHGKMMGITRELEGLRANNQLFPLDLAINEMWVGNRRLFCGIVRDITERKKVQRMKEEFISTVSHELRTPLTSIRGSLGLLAGGVMGDFSPQVKMLLETANRNTERLLLLINDILDIDKIERGDIPFKMEAIDVPQLLEQAIEVNQGYAGEFEVDFVLVEPLPQVHINGDWDRLQQVVSNLLSNAAKFSRKGGCVEIGAELRGPEICLYVTDHGQGIPEEFRPKLFDKFTQSDSSDTRQAGGTGLGMSIVKAIVERHGGEVSFETVEGRGTTFWVCLRVAERVG